MNDYRGNTCTTLGAMQCLGYAQFTSVSNSTAINIATATPNTGVAFSSFAPPKMPRIAVISCEAQAMRYRDDGTAPTSSVGMPLAATTQGFVYQGQLESLQIIGQVAAGTIDIAYYA